MKVIFFIVYEIFVWPHYWRTPGARGLRFIEPPELPPPGFYATGWMAVKRTCMYLCAFGSL